MRPKLDDDDCRLCRQGFGLHLRQCPMSTTTQGVERKQVEKKEDRWEAKPTYRRPSRPRISRADYLASVKTEHGTRSSYRRERAEGIEPCDLCREANAANMRASRQRNRKPPT